VENILQLAADVVKGVAKGGNLPDARATEVEAVIKERSPSFVREGQELQILTCALLVVLKLLTETNPTHGVWCRRDILALGLWSGLGFQIPRTEERLEALRSKLLVTSRDLTLASAAYARTRQEVPAITLNAPEEYEATEIGKAIQDGVPPAVDALRLNAELDREEIDFLWWILSGWSKLAGKSFSSMSDTAAVVAAGFEAGSVVRRIPVEAHKHLVLRMLKQDLTVSMHDVLESLKDEREQITAFFGNNPLFAGRESLFPLIKACVAGKAGGKSAGAHSLKLSDWAARALLESSILHVGCLPGNLV
jgi:hypothetical protein